MRIKEIELDNFKSFGRPTVVPLLDGFTTISGPNGSGKSNIIDSLLFALGLSSTRSMRAERLPDLLNNLSGKNEAKVRVKFVSNDNEEIEVTRRIKVKPNGYTSTYILNGRVATLTEVHDQLVRYNVSPTGFNVIMQGDVTGIVTMSASDRRRIIDELAGVAEFDRRIDQAKSELGTVSDKIDHQRIVLVEIVARLEQLRTDRDQALKYLELKTKKESIERDLIFVRTNELDLAVNEKRQVLIRLDERETFLASKLYETEVGLLTLRSEMGRIDEEIRDKGGNEQLLLRQDLENKRGELTREENKLSNLDGVFGEKEKTVKAVESQIETIEKHLRKLAKQKSQHLEDQKTVKVVLDEKQAALKVFIDQIESLRKEKDKSSDKVSNLHDDLQKLREDKHQKQVRQTELKANRINLEKELEGIRTRATELIAKSAGSKALGERIDRQYQDAYALVLGISRDIEQLEGELESTQEEIESKQNNLEQVKRRVIELETQKEVTGTNGYGHAVEAIMAAGIRGVYGTIGELGSCEGDYTQALETCIGPRLSHVVVEDDQVAKECIEYLKSTQSGRATFVPLNKISSNPPGLLPERQGVVDFAYNMIDFEPRFAKAFQYACGQTVVMNDLDSARRMLNQARMVTVGGELLEKSGSITGGQESKSRLHFSKRGETDLAVLKQTQASVQEQIKSLKEAVKELTVSLNEEKEKLVKAKADAMQRQSAIEDNKKQTIELDQGIAEIKPRLREKGDEIDVIDQEMDNITIEVESFEKKIEELARALENVKDKGANSKLEKLILDSEEVREDVDSTEKECKEIQRLIDKIETEEVVETNTRDNLKEQVTNSKAEMENLTIQRPLLTESVDTIKLSIAEVEKKVNEISVELESLRAQKDEIHANVTEQEVQKSKYDQEAKRVNEERKNEKLALFDLERDFEEIKAQLAIIKAENPDYEPPNQQTVDDLKKEVEKLERRMRHLEPVNMKALDEYNQTETRKTELDTNLETLDLEREEIIQRISGYDELKKSTFLEAFHAVNTNFQEIFAELSHGHGKLELEYPDSPFDGGLIIRAQPRDKKMQRIEALSGGEKSLTALSFVFAFQRYAPAPFYAFDEVDMMLDGANADRLARMVKRQSKQAQFVVVSLRRPMIEQADHAIGVSLRNDGYSRVVGISEIQIPAENPEHDEEPQARGA
ncbi:chromosome segregation protein SMC [bacterium]|nr:chromosome segregation protein SMC [bacterium]